MNTKCLPFSCRLSVVANPMPERIESAFVDELSSLFKYNVGASRAVNVGTRIAIEMNYEALVRGSFFHENHHKIWIFSILSGNLDRGRNGYCMR